VPETVDAGIWCQVSDVVGERCCRKIDQIAALREADGPPGPPMHRYGMFRLDAADSACRLLGVEMALTMARNNAGSPASDWHQGYVDVLRLLQLKLRTCVPRIPPSARALNKAERRTAMGAPSVSPTVVVSGQDTYLPAAKLHKVTRLDFTKPQPAVGDWLQQASGAYWGDQNRRAWDKSERGKVCVVEMQMRDQDDVRMGSVLSRSLAPDSTEMTHSGGQNWVEQEGCSAINQSGCAVAPPCQQAGHCIPRFPKLVQRAKRIAPVYITGRTRRPARALPRRGTGWADSS
jgi:hypothetical protein